MAFEASFYENWQTISIAAAAISVLGSVMLIMLSRLFGLRNLEQTGKTELIYAASTVLIVATVLVLIRDGENLLANGSGESLARCLYLTAFKCSCVLTDPSLSTAVFSQNTLIDWMILYLSSPASCVQSFMNVLYTLSIPIEAMASIYMEIFMSEHASGFGVKWVAERITNTTQSLSFYMYMFYLIVHVLEFIKYYAGFFFSVGVAMRAFPPTRGVGAYMMALSFGLYFVFPLSYILIATMSLPHAQSSILIPPDDVCAAPDGDSVKYLCLLPEVTSAETYTCEGASAANAFTLPERIRANSVALEDLLTIRINDFTKHLVSSICIFPLVAFVILLTFVLNTTNLFGGNIPEIGRGLVKLI